MFKIQIPGVVTKVIDGDTIEIRFERTMRIRLLDCWSPETRTKDLVEKAKGIKAKKHLQKLIDGQEVEITIPIDSDGKFGDSMSFGRVLAYVQRLTDGADLSELQVETGHATKERK